MSSIRTPLTVSPHEYFGDATGRPLDYGTIYFGEPDKDPEFYPIDVYSDEALTQPIPQPIRTKGGFINVNGDIIEIYGRPAIYSVKVLDQYGRKIFYKGKAMRNNVNDDIIAEIDAAIQQSKDDGVEYAKKAVREAINKEAIEGGEQVDTFVVATPKFDGAVARTQAEVNEERKSVLEFGVKVGTEQDNTPFFNTAMQWADDNDRELFVPDGIYRVDGRVIANGGITVAFGGKATLKRYKAHSESTEPVFSLRGIYTTSIGGIFITENDHPHGVITCGHMGRDDPKNALWWRCLTPRIYGVEKLGNIGIWLPSAQIDVGNSSANYFGTIDKPMIEYCDEAIVFDEVANAHTVIAPQIQKCMSGAIVFYGAYANTVLGGFLHGSKNGVIGVRIKRKRRGTFHNSMWNVIRGFGVEPASGGMDSKALEIDQGCEKNDIQIMGNTPASNIIEGDARVKNKFDTGTMTDWRPFETAKLSVNGASGESTQFPIEKHDIAYIGSAQENTTYDVAKSRVSGSSGGLVEIVIHGFNGALGRVVPARYLVAFKNLGTAEFEILESPASTLNTPATLVPTVNGSEITWSVKYANNGTSTVFSNAAVTFKHYRYGYSKSRLSGEIEVFESKKMPPQL